MRKRKTTAPEAQSKPTEWVELNEITREPSFQVRDKLDSGTILTYATMLRNGQKPPPIKLARINGALFLLDGWHRLRARDRVLAGTLARKERREFSLVEATIEDMPGGDALWVAAKANLGNGLPLNRKDKRKVFTRYMELRRYLDKFGRVKSSRKIAEELGGWVSHVTLLTWIKKHYPAVAAQIESERAPTPRPDNAPPFNFESPEVFPKTALGFLEAARAAARGIVNPVERKAFLNAVLEVAHEVEHGPPSYADLL